MRMLKFHYELDLLEVMFTDKFKRSPGVLEVEGRLQVFTPNIRETEVSFASRVLEQHFHKAVFNWLYFLSRPTFHFRFSMWNSNLAD
jgi:hypothetical protein